MSSNLSPASSGLAFRRTIAANHWPARAAAILLGSSLLWASAKLQVPFWPVPVTLQTYVVLTLGALFGWRLGAATVGTYLAEGILGLPVFAGTPTNGIGVAYMAGPTGDILRAISWQSFWWAPWQTADGIGPFLVRRLHCSSVN
jgi:hypothetical protein